MRGGEIETIDSLRELQKRIGSRELNRSDEIARGTEGWKKLGSIPELDTFFRAVEGPKPSEEPVEQVRPPAQQTPSTPKPPRLRERQKTLLGVMPVSKEGPPPPVQRAKARPYDALPDGGTAAAPTGMPRAANDTGELPRDAARTAPVPGPTASELNGLEPGPPVADPLEPPETPRTGIEDAEFEESPSATTRSSLAPAYYDDDDDIPGLPGRGRSGSRWIAVAVILGVAVLVAARWDQLSSLLGGGTQVGPEDLIRQGDETLAEDHFLAYQRAIQAYQRATDSGEPDGELMVKLSRANALAAQAALDEPSVSGGPEVAADYARAAMTSAEAALAIDPDNPNATVARADALRLLGDLKGARVALEEAKGIPFGRTGELFRVDARLVAAERGDRLERGYRSAVRAVDEGPDVIRYRLLLARTELAAQRPAKAETQLGVALQLDPSHPVALALREKLEDAKNATAVGTPDAATQDAATASPDPGDITSSEPAAGEPEPKASGQTKSDAKAKARAETQRRPKPKPSVQPKPKADTKAAQKPSAERKPKPRRRRREAPAAASEAPASDEYDRLVGSADRFSDGRPPAHRDHSWYMREGRAALAGRNFTRARAYFESALEARPGSADATDALGQTALDAGDVPLALRYFRSAAQRGHPDAYYNLGMAYQRLGRNEEAVSAYYTYLEKQPSGTHASAARTAIKTLQPQLQPPGKPGAPKKEPPSSSEGGAPSPQAKGESPPETVAP